MRRRYRWSAGLGIALVAASAVFAQGFSTGQTTPKPKVVPLSPTAIYGPGEKIGWTVSGDHGKFSYTVKRNNRDLVASGTIDLAGGTATIEVPPVEPSMLYMELTPADRTAGRPRGWGYGAAVMPMKIRPAAPRPRDFDSFWRDQIKALEAIPENAVLTPGDSGRPDVDYATIKMDHVNGTHVYGQLAKPKRRGKYPAVLVLQWASPPYPLPKAWAVDRAAQGWLTLNIEPHDVPVDATPEYYRSLPAAIKNYAGIGVDDRDQNYFLSMYLRGYRAVDYLTHCPDWDGKTIVVTGGSMGGQQSLCVAGLHRRVTHVIIEEPSGCDIDAVAHGRQTGYPNFPQNDPKAMATAPYFDCVNFARNIHATCLVAMGFVDTVAPPTGIWTAFNQIRGPKEAAPMPEAPHNNLATREQLRPSWSRAGEWFESLAKGERIHPRT